MRKDYIKRRTFLVTALAPALGRAQAQNTRAASPRVVRFGGELDETDRRLDFSFALLSAALRAAGDTRRVERVKGMTQERRQFELRRGTVDVTTLPSVGPEPSGLLSVRFPIRRGILGVRLLLSLPERADEIASVRNLERLKKLRMGYVTEWSDTKQFKDLGFGMVTTPSYSGMFDLLRRGRADYLSRGISEIWAELAEPKLGKDGIVVVPKIALSQPLDDYFYIRPDDRVLADTILNGIKLLHHSGEYSRLFLEHFGQALKDANLKERRIIPVVGYGVRPNTPLELFDVLEVDPATARFVIPS